MPRWLSVSLLVSALAWADNTAGEADAAFALGNEAFAQRDYQEALAHYFRSYRLVPNRNVLFNLARCFEALDKPEEAYRYWYDVSRDPALPAKDAPDVEQALARLGPKVALLEVSTTPPGAEVFVDRVDLGSRGQTPRTLAVTPGAHTLILRRAGSHDVSLRVKAQTGVLTRKAVELPEVVGTVTVEGTPAGATIRESGRDGVLGRVPAQLSLPQGQHLLVVEAEGHLPSHHLVEVKADATAAVTVALIETPRPKGKVGFTCNRDGARVKVNGREVGFTPAVVELVPGTYAVSIEADDYEPYRTKIRVEETSDLKVRAELVYAPPKIEAASKTALSLDEAPASVSVVTREEIAAFGYQTLPEALRAVRGLFFNDDRIYSYVGVRGLLPDGDYNTRVLLLYDGHAINDAYSGQGYLGREFDVDLGEVERIEIVRGPDSLVFGTGAFFGVINVVPRKSLSGKSVEATLGGGGERAVKARAAARLASDAAALQVGAAGYLAAGATETSFGDQGVVVGLDDERAIGLNLRATWNGFTLSGRWNQRRKQSPTPFEPTPLFMPGSWTTDARGYVQLQYDRSVGPVSLTGRLAYDGSRYRGVYPYDDADGNRAVYSTIGAGDWLTAEARAGVTLGATNQLTVGVEGQLQFSGQAVNAATIVPTTRFFVAATVLDEWRVTRWLFLHAGVRIDKYGDVREWALAPRGAVVVRLYRSGVSKLIVARGFRAPTIYDQYWHDDNVTTRPALSLKPERITTFELEHTHSFTSELRLTVAGFVNLLDDMIVWLQESAATPACGTAEAPLQCYVATNGAQPGLGFGGEVQLRWQPARFTLLEAQYGFAATRDTTSVAPQHLAGARAMVPLVDRRLRVAAQLAFQSARRLADGTGRFSSEGAFLDVGLSGQLGPLRYFAGVKNLFDTRSLVPVISSPVPAVPTYGRTFWLELGASY